MSRPASVPGPSRRRARVALLALSAALLPAAAAAQVCVGLPPTLDRLSIGAGFEGRDGAAGLGAAADLRAGRALLSAEYRRVGGTLQKERAASLQATLLSTPVARLPLCPFLRLDFLEQEQPAPNLYPQQAVRRSAAGLGVALGIPFSTAYLKHILHFAPRVDLYRWEVRYPDGSDPDRDVRLAPGLATGLTVRAPGLFYVRFLHTYARPRDAWRGYFTVRVGTWF